VVADIVLKLLRLLATPLIFFSIVHALLSAEVRGRTAGRLAWVLMTNTLVAVALGLLVVSLAAPGEHVHFPAPSAPLVAHPFDPVADFVGKLPTDFISPFANNEVIGILVLAIALGMALRQLAAGAYAARVQTVAGYVELGRAVTLKLLHWVLELVPLAVLAIVARVVGITGFQPLLDMIWFVAAVAIGLSLMAAFYALRLRWSARMRPGEFYRGAFDAFALAFSTASSAATLPVTFECATVKLGIPDETASLGIMAGGTFNHDGSALYQSMAVVFVAQSIGMHLAVGHLVVIALMSVVASVGVAGIPAAGFVTMVAVFSAVRVPIEYIPLLLPLDWILDRCRTTINVAGVLASTCLIDRSRS
jgi:DAACS family dicarboxylate/amino acid:cation (Na+ or H+) symporter